MLDFSKLNKFDFFFELLEYSVDKKLNNGGGLYVCLIFLSLSNG